MTDTTEKPLLDLSTAVQLARKVIEGRKSYVYAKPSQQSGCKYEHGGQPSCVVGQIFSRAGVHVEALADLDKRVDSRAKYTTPTLFTIADQRVLDFLESIQTQQDSGVPWGRAFDNALQFVKLPDEEL